MSNMKNSKKLSVMQEKVETLPLEIENIVFKPFSYRVLGDRDDGNGYHFRLINIQAFINYVVSLKPAAVKGVYVKSIAISATMSPAVRVVTQ
ncbi:MAG: hypothetical protein IIY07_06945 [Thermoguttaceae bacterium]|nr:hypothetical protein [Thermoguttaceae bacterium]